jgi:putative membrane protein
MAADLFLQMMDPWNWGRGTAIRGLIIFFFLAFIALLALGVALLWRRGSTGTESSGSGDQALDTLRLRYARGEISREEFLQAIEDLGGPAPQDPGSPPPPATSG